MMLGNYSMCHFQRKTEVQNPNEASLHRRIRGNLDKEMLENT